MKNYLKKIPGSGFLFAGTFVPLTNNGGSSGVPTLTNFFQQGDLAGFFNGAFWLAISAGAILAVLRIAYAGWKYMSTDAFGQKSDAKEMIRNAIIGLLLLFGIWIILNQINPCLLDLNILKNLGGSSSGSCGGASSQTTVTPYGSSGINQIVPAGTSNVNGQPVDQSNDPLQTQPM